ncbi:hypothetical protein DAPPUDRAFT_266709 [Daphnia pulex]|uniref:Uncharacterized protein n=1 Tax=Daphnia pulex TaxID=6669 RepID=E9HVI2_DAPPU|nr:hypothetical protein DAPPUDRAFT_266709 [Daphnia pulex]|eukprot:EFX64249.1 hypothetical protein DAPPUDRAFT_266709 [Daphnia pulex]
MKNGGTPLNWATMKEVVIALVELGCRIDTRNFSGHTALHVMVQRDRFECVVALLSCGAASKFKLENVNISIDINIPSVVDRLHRCPPLAKKRSYLFPRLRGEQEGSHPQRVKG